MQNRLKAVKIMADTVSSSRELKLDYRFQDLDTRTTSIPNPKNNITRTNIQNLAGVLANTQAFVGDKNNSPFETITSAKIVEQTRTQLDLS